MIGVTVINHEFRDVGAEAVKRFSSHTGLEVCSLYSKGDAMDAYELKLRIPTILDRQTIVFFDADWWMLRDADMSQFDNSEEFFAARDPGIWDPHTFPSHDAKVLEIPNPSYFNSGFWVANTRRADHREAFDIARQLFSEHKNKRLGLNDPGEQSCLNAGVLRSGCQMGMLPFEWNAYLLAVRFGAYHEYPREIIGLHAAGVWHTEKMQWLNAMASVFGAEHRPMLAGASEFYQKHVRV